MGGCVPAEGQLVVGAFYEQSEAYHVWAGLQQHNITVHTSDGESYGIDIRQGDLPQNKRHPITCELGVRNDSLPHGKKTPQTR